MQLTTTQQRVLDEIRASNTPVGTCDIKKAYAYRSMKALLESGLIYIAAWRRANNNNGLYALYLAGDLPGVKKPTADREELMRRKSARDSVARQLLRDLAVGNAPTPPPPTLPTNTPTYNFWGI